MLRPHGATALCIVVWVVCLALQIDAFARAGVAGVRTLPALVLVAVLVWFVLWAPRLVLRQDEVVVHNVWTTSHLPFAVVSAVRIGAMVRFDVDDAAGRTRTITAWNAPGVRRDRPTFGSARRGRDGARHVGEAERFARDLEASRSSMVRDRWQAHPAAPGGAGGTNAAARTRPNTVGIAVLLCAVAAAVVRAVI